MRFLIDAQLPPALCGWFGERGFEAEHVSERLGGQTPDAEIAARAAAQGFVLVTKDDDFALRHPPGGYRLVWLRCGNITNRALRAWLAGMVNGGGYEGPGASPDRADAMIWAMTELMGKERAAPRITRL